MPQETNNKMNGLIVKAMSDKAFKVKFVENPLAIFKAEGIEIPAGLEIIVLENTDKVFHLVLPAKSSELSDDELDNVAGGLCDAGWYDGSSEQLLLQLFQSAGLKK